MLEISRKLPLLGGEIEIVLYDIEPQIAEVLIDEAFREGIKLQKVFNAYDPDSELSRLNKKRKLKVSKHMKNVITLSLKYCDLTNGAYDISLGKQFMQRKKGAKVAPVRCSYRDIVIKDNQITLRHPDVLIDLGSVAKGYIGDMLADYLKRAGVESAFLDLRGDLITFGEYPEEVRVQHPREKDTIMKTFILPNAAVATSGDYRQYTGTFETSHIINKRDIISATVVADTLALADCLATCLMVVGMDGLERFKEIQYMVIDEKLNTRGTIS
jgi:FAD:protein FMN transferase